MVGIAATGEVAVSARPKALHDVQIARHLQAPVDRKTLDDGQDLQAIRFHGDNLLLDRRLSRRRGSDGQLRAARSAPRFLGSVRTLHSPQTGVFGVCVAGGWG
jgi:hypothetical protein